MEVSAQLHSAVALPRGQKSLVPSGLKVKGGPRASLDDME
jgi:hypothetical protein